jgi:hypothetical protein
MRRGDVRHVYVRIVQEFAVGSVSFGYSVLPREFLRLPERPCGHCGALAFFHLRQRRAYLAGNVACAYDAHPELSVIVTHFCDFSTCCT